MKNTTGANQKPVPQIPQKKQSEGQSNSGPSYAQSTRSWNRNLAAPQPQPPWKETLRRQKEAKGSPQKSVVERRVQEIPQESKPSELNRPGSSSAPALVRGQSLRDISTLRTVVVSLQSENGIEALLSELESSINEIITSLENEENELSEAKVKALNEKINQLKQLAARYKGNENKEVGKLFESLEKMAGIVQKMVNRKEGEEVLGDERQVFQDAKKEFLEYSKSLLESLKETPGMQNVLSSCEKFFEKLEKMYTPVDTSNVTNLTNTSEAKDFKALASKTTDASVSPQKVENKPLSKRVAVKIEEDTFRDSEYTFHMVASPGLIVSGIIIAVSITAVIILDATVLPAIMFPIMIGMVLVVGGVCDFYTTWTDPQYEIESLQRSVVEVNDELDKMLKEVRKKLNNDDDYRKYVEKLKEKFTQKINKGYEKADYSSRKNKWLFENFKKYYLDACVEIMGNNDKAYEKYLRLLLEGISYYLSAYNNDDDVRLVPSFLKKYLHDTREIIAEENKKMQQGVPLI